jgi:hypothetical protein
VSNIAGEFIDSQSVIGQSSRANYLLASFDPLNNPANKENYDNSYINTSADGILDFSEENPFGNI